MSAQYLQEIAPSVLKDHAASQHYLQGQSGYGVTQWEGSEQAAFYGDMVAADEEEEGAGR